MPATRKRQNLNDVTKVEVGESTTLGVVQEPCDNSNGGSWYCVTHDKGFRYQLEKDFHIDHGSHALAWTCFEHGVERP